MTTLRVETLTPDSFAPFGRVLTQPAGEPDATGPGWRWWAEIGALAPDARSWGVGFLDLHPTDLRFDWAERHMRSEEAVIATSGDLLVYVGPPDRPEEPERMPPADRFRAFRIPPGAGIVMDRAVWHGAPFAADRASTALVFLLEGTGREDVTVVRFPESPVEIDAQ